MKPIEDYLRLVFGMATMQLLLRNPVLVSQLLWASTDHMTTLQELAAGVPLWRARWRRRRRRLRRRLYLLHLAARFARRDRRQAKTALVLALLKWPHAVGAPA